MGQIAIRQEERPRAEQFSGRLFSAALASMELCTIDMGLKLGLYALLSDGRARTSAQLAREAGVHERYAREWLEAQTAAGVLEVDRAEKPADERRYTLPAAHAHVLLDDTSMAYMAPAAGLGEVVSRLQPRLLEVFRTGQGIPYSDYDLHHLQAGFTKPIFLNLLGSEWIPSIPDVDAALRRSGARVADVGCGDGWAAVAMAEAYPTIHVDGFDADRDSIEAARHNAAERGVADRVSFHVTDLRVERLPGAYDLLLAIEMVHDLSDPVAVLRNMRERRAPGGAVLVIDERAHETFEPATDEMERFFYAASVLHCLPVGMDAERSAGTGTVMRPGTLRAYAREAGFERVETLPLEHPQFRVYRLH